MSGSPLSVKLNCKSWQQLAAIHSRDLSRGAFFFKTKKPPPLGTMVNISLTLPSGSTIQLAGQIYKLIGEGELEGRGPGIDVSIRNVPQSVMWLVESALASAGLPSKAQEVSSPAPVATPAPAQRPTPPTPPQTPLVASPKSEDDTSLEDGDEQVHAEGDLVKALWQELASMSKMNAFQLLDLPYGADEAEIRSAFQQLSKKYHPDRFLQYSSFEIRELANEVFILLRDAYQLISNEQSRQKLLRQLQPVPSGKPEKSAPPPTPAAPRTKPMSAAAADIRQSNEPTTDPASQPLDLTTEAPEHRDDRVNYALGFLENGQYEQALRIMRVEARKNPKNIKALAGVELAAGRLALADGDRMEAAERFEAALAIDPANERAAREIAEMRRHATSQRRGLLSKLMKKV